MLNDDAPPSQAFTPLPVVWSNTPGLTVWFVD
jgi:hypothetical protein